MVLSFFVVVVLFPGLRFRAAYDSSRWEILTEMVLSNSMAWFLTLWVFFFGSCLGSFLNVVAYRIPSKLTILGSSRCPFCMVSIESRHNFPIIGWFMLRGRCAACRLPISPRYFVVEVIAGLLLLWLFVAELVSNGTNLPGGVNYKIESLFRAVAMGQYQEFASHNWSLVRIFFVHCIVGYTILTAALMRLDRFRLPSFWKAIHFLVVFVLIAIWPADFDFARSAFQTLDRVPEFWQRVDFQLTGFLVGSFIGFQYCNMTRDWNSGMVFVFGLLGACFGLSATISIPEFQSLVILQY